MVLLGVSCVEAEGEGGARRRLGVAAAGAKAHSAGGADQVKMCLPLEIASGKLTSTSSSSHSSALGSAAKPLPPTSF